MNFRKLPSRAPADQIGGGTNAVLRATFAQLTAHIPGFRVQGLGFGLLQFVGFATCESIRMGGHGGFDPRALNLISQNVFID